MISRHKLLARHCVRDLVRVVDEVGPTITAPTLIPFDMPMVALLLLSKILRDERTFVLICLEEMGADMSGLTRDVDALINQKNAEGRDAGLPEFSSRAVLYAMDPFVEEWLDRAGREACRLGHRYLSVEHLLLAIVVDAEEPLGAVLSRHGLDHVRLREAILAARTRVPHPEVPEILVSHSEVPGILDTSRPFGAGWDKPATGVPRRYSMAMILGMMVVYVLLFAAMRLLGTMTEIFLVVTVLFTGVALGQSIPMAGDMLAPPRFGSAPCSFPRKSSFGTSMSGYRRTAVSQLPSYSSSAFPWEPCSATWPDAWPRGCSARWTGTRSGNRAARRPLNRPCSIRSRKRNDAG